MEDHLSDGLGDDAQLGRLEQKRDPLSCSTFPGGAGRKPEGVFITFDVSQEPTGTSQGEEHVQHTAQKA